MYRATTFYKKTSKFWSSEIIVNVECMTLRISHIVIKFQQKSVIHQNCGKILRKKSYILFFSLFLAGMWGIIFLRRRLPKGFKGHRRRGETRGGRVPKKVKKWGDVFYGWSLMLITFFLSFQRLYSFSTSLGWKPARSNSIFNIGCFIHFGIITHCMGLYCYKCCCR